MSSLIEIIGLAIKLTTEKLFLFLQYTLSYLWTKLDQVVPRSLRPLHFNFYNFSLFERHPRFDDKLLALLAGGSDKNLIS